MMNENIRAIRKSKGLSQEELAIKLNVVRQTISKWEQGLSVPDSDMLLAISEALETPVSTLLGETVAETKAEDLSAISQRLEVINLQLARRKDMRFSSCSATLSATSCASASGLRTSVTLMTIALPPVSFARSFLMTSISEPCLPISTPGLPV